MVARGVSENMRMVEKGAAGREGERETEKEKGREGERERDGRGCKAVIRVLGVPWG